MHWQHFLRYSEVGYISGNNFFQLLCIPQVTFFKDSLMRSMPFIMLKDIYFLTADPSSKATLWVKAQHEGALTPPCIVWKKPQVPHTARQVACHSWNNSRGKRSSIPPHKTRPDSPVPTLQVLHIRSTFLNQIPINWVDS